MNITICGRRKVDSILSLGWYEAMVSIGDPGHGNELRGTLRTGRDLLLDFHDSWPGRRANNDGLCLEIDIAAICAFADDTLEHTMTVVHCGRGRSRSTSAAIIMQIRKGQTPMNACRWLFSAYPRSRPNGYMLSLAEAYLDRNDIIPACRQFNIKGV